MSVCSAKRLGGALILAALICISVAGCSQQPKTPSLPLQEPEVLPSGTVPGIEFVSVASLPMGQKADVDGWQAGGASLDSAPTLKPGTYTPVLATADVAKATVSTGTANGIAQKLVTFTMTAEGTQKLAAYSAAHGGDSLLIVVGGKAFAEIAVSQPMTDGKLVTGDNPAVTEALSKAIVAAP
jgi:preprotein translocase subunit SecD